MYDLLCFSSTDWDGVWGSRQQVMLRFARRGYRVLFVEQPAGLKHLLRYPDLRHRRLRRWREGLRSIARSCTKVSLAAVGMGIVVYAGAVSPLLSSLGAFLQLGLLVVAGLIVYLAIAYVLHLDELHLLLSPVRGRYRALVKGAN